MPDNRIRVEYWRADSKRWVPVDIHEHVRVGGGGINPPVPPDEGVAKRVLVKGKDVTAKGFESFLDRETYNEASLTAWCYPEVWDKLLRRLKIEFPLPQKPVKWKDGRLVKASSDRPADEGGH